jgi:hypothetical protein
MQRPWKTKTDCSVIGSSRPPNVGYQSLLAWMRGYGQIRAVEVESTGSFGATLTRALSAAAERCAAQLCLTTA